MVQDIQTLVDQTDDLIMNKMSMVAEKNLISDCDTASVRSSSYDTQGDSGTSLDGETDDGKEEPRKKLISKPIVEGKTYTTILYEVIAGLDNPTTISYFQVDADQPRTRNGRFVIECHLNGKLYGTGEGSSKKAAKQLASELALQQLLKEMPSISEDVSRVRNGFPSRKKMRTRRRAAKPERRQQWRPTPKFAAPIPKPLLDAQERRMLQLEYERVNKMVKNIESLTSYLGFPGLTPYESALFTSDTRSYLDHDFDLFSDEFEQSRNVLPPVPPHPFDRDYPVDSQLQGFEEPDTLEFMRKMRARAGTSGTKKSCLSPTAQEFTPQTQV